MAAVPKLINRLPRSTHGNTGVQSQRRRDGEVSDRSEKKASEARKASDGNRFKPTKTRKYDEAFIALEFTVNTVVNEKRPVCVSCLVLWQRTA